MVWICNGGNLPLGHNDDHDDCVSLPHYSRCASELCNLLKTIWPSLNRSLKILKRGQLAPCNLRYNGNHWPRSEWVLVIEHNPKRGQTFNFQFGGGGRICKNILLRIKTNQNKRESQREQKFPLL